MSDMDFSLEGLTDLSADLTKAIRLYPNMAEERIRKIANNLKKDVIDEEKKAIKNDDTRTKNKLTSSSGFSVGKVRGYNENMEVDFSAKSKIFHLVENGHEQTTKDGKRIGWVQGNYVVKKMRIKYAEYVMPFEMDQLLKDITKACDL
ncbi:hypothetical protein [Anaerocolumna chitinilytica]|uniref:HK97 gp10 family phage protein n=1 Tax=Anaerocolumna chitinilytica TaxID=1727145 RepID=A0A7M3S9Z5_9FIRM|nr:hypothetical protein [Anaerocolumna chitinilytica]BCK01413.1 hypothetical protein bsdcttw_44530 [Anaerocolumna chitinilytica]